MQQLYYFENVSYRGETELQKAIRCSGELDAWFDKRIYLDIDGDNFPERVDIHTYDPGSVYCELSFYDPELVKWKELQRSSSPYKIYYGDEYTVGKIILPRNR